MGAAPRRNIAMRNIAMEARASPPPSDRLLLWAIALLASLAAVFHPRPWHLLAACAAMAAFLWAARRLAPRSRAGEALHAFAPLLVIIGIYQTVGFVVAVVNPARWDGFFAGVDARWFGALVPAWHGALGRPAWLSDVMSACYVSYYLVPTVMAVALYARARREEFDRLVFALLVTLLASYAGYFLFPTSGPRVALADGPAVLGGGVLSAGVRAWLNVAELNLLDAFPSGHTAISLVFLALGWSMFPRWRAPLVANVTGIVFSTVYLSHHYVIDLVAGALLAGAVLVAMPALERLFRVGSAAWLPATATADAARERLTS